MRKRGGLIVLLSAMFAAGGATAAVTATSASAAPLPSAVTAHVVSGCGAAVTMVTPARAGAQLPASAIGMPDGSGTLMNAAARDHVQWLSGLTCKSQAAPRDQGIREGSVRNSTEYFYNWSGYQTDVSTRPTYVQAYWNVPKVCCSTHGGDYNSIWPGLGSGDSKKSAELIQDGSEEAVDGSSTYYRLWYEIFPNEAEQIITTRALIPSPGNKVFFSVLYNYPKRRATFTVCDLSKRKCAAFYQSSGPPNKQVEWIVERPGICSGKTAEYPSLADFKSVTLSGAFWDKNSKGKPAYSISHEGHFAIDMIDENNTTMMAVPGGLSHGGSEFTVTHKNNGSPSSIGSC